MFITVILTRGAQPFLVQRQQCIVFSALERRRQNYELNCREYKKQFLYLTSFLYCLWFDIVFIRAV